MKEGRVGRTNFSAKPSLWIALVLKDAEIHSCTSETVNIEANILRL